MKIKSIIRGFTLIELLVVITIIGILATGAVSIYTSQIQKARDSVRLTDIKAIQSGVEQLYQDDSVYPLKGNAFTGITAYTKLSEDPKKGQGANNTALDYFYNVGTDANGVIQQEYELSITFEQSGNTNSKSINTSDGGNDDTRLEIGVNVNDAGGSSIKPTKVLAKVTGLKLTCVVPAGGAGTTGNCTTAINPMLIRK